MRQLVHWPLLFWGVMRKEPEPVSWQLVGDVVYVSCSPFEDMPVQRVHLDVSREEPEKSSDQMTLKPEMVSGAVAWMVLASRRKRVYVLRIDIMKNRNSKVIFKDRLEEKTPKKKNRTYEAERKQQTLIPLTKLSGATSKNTSNIHKPPIRARHEQLPSQSFIHIV
jgi:hypothetical protein